MNNKPKLLFIVEAMGGGVFTYIVDLTNELVKSYDIYVAHAVRQQTPSDYMDYFDRKIHFIKIENFKRSVGLYDIKAFFEIKKIAEEIKPDIIHLHSSKAGALGRWALTGIKNFDGDQVPMFYTPHGYSFLMSDQSTAKRVFYKFIETVSAKKLCMTISCSKGEHNETLKLTRNAIYINNGINTKQLDGMIASVKKMDHVFTVFTLGRICYQKNPRLFNQIAESMPDTKFLWIGDGELRDELTSENIEVTGWTDRKIAIQYAVNADVFLLTSLWEGLPISLLEAMYMKKLCVVSDVIGNNDVIKNGKNGYLCRNVKDFLDGIQGDISLGQQAKENIEQMYNTVIMAQKYSAVYRKSLKRNKTFIAKNQ